MHRLTPLADDLWCAESELRVPLGLIFPIRMTVLRRGSDLALVSPIAIDDELATTLAELGDVETVVAPNAMHHTHLATTVMRYPRARVLGVPLLRDKCPGVAFDAMLEDGRAPFDPDVELLGIAGAPAMDERVLLHRPSRTLIVTDLIFNLPTAANWISRFVFRYLSRALGKPAQSRLWRSLTKDREAAGRSVNRLLELDFDRLVMAHGEVIPTGGREVLEKATTWMRADVRAQLAAPA